jgi:hypothetical protein
MLFGIGVGTNPSNDVLMKRGKFGHTYAITNKEEPVITKS